jgi:hypothetical protein
MEICNLNLQLEGTNRAPLQRLPKKYDIVYCGVIAIVLEEENPLRENEEVWGRDD